MALRLKHVILGGVLLSVVLAELFVLTPALFIWHHSAVAQLREDTLNLFKANVDITTFPTVAQTVRIGERLATFSPVRGGLVLNAIGDELGAFGQRPSLAFAQVRLDGVRERLTPDRAFLDVFFPADATGLAHPVILRLDASHVPVQVFERLRDKALVVLWVALVAGFCVAVLLHIWIVRPMVQFRDAAIRATDNPDRADSFRLRWQRHDEMGEAARALDLLLTAVSIVHQDDLAANSEAIERAAYAVLTYDPNGRLMAANPAALQLFGVATPEELGQQSGSFVRVRTVAGVVDMSPIEMLAGGADLNQQVSIASARVIKRCHMNAVTIRRRNGTVLRHVVTLLDISKSALYTEQLEAEAKRLVAETEGQRRRIAELKGMFESCLVILASQSDVGAPKTPAEVPEAAPAVTTERVVNYWYGELARCGLVTGRLEHDALADVRGDEEQVGALFRQAFLTVYARSKVTRPVMALRAGVLISGHIGFELFEKVGEGGGELRAVDDSSTRGAAITLLGFMHTLAGAGGRMTPLSPSVPGENAIAFALPAGPKRVEKAGELAAPAYPRALRG